ncbi:unnamed protein product, partial [Brassica napus]
GVSKACGGGWKSCSSQGGVEASVKEINAELQGTEDEERYDSCKDDMSTDSQIQENRRDLCAETDADSEDVGSGGKRHRMRSSKIYGVYTPDPRVKKLMWDIATGHSVCNRFFLEIAEPGKWMSDESAFSADNDKLQFEWGKNVAQYVIGKSKGQKMKLGLGRDVDTVYTPMNWGGDHWVGLCIKLNEGHVTVFDSYVPHTEIEVAEGHMCSVVQSLPYILEKYAGHKCYKVKEGLRIYSWSRQKVFITTKGVATVGHVLPSS